MTDPNYPDLLTRVQNLENDLDKAMALLERIIAVLEKKQ